MAFTEVTNQSYFSRIGGAFKGIIFGGLLFIIAFPLQFWNEGRAVRRIKTLAEGRGAVIADVSVDSVNQSNDGKLVHMIGRATAEGTLTDQKFAVSVDNALKLQRTVEMYQWHEDVETTSRKKVGGGKTTEKTYSYYKDWSAQAVDSTSFHSRSKSEIGNGNPPMPYRSDIQTARPVDLGAFQLNDSLVAMINQYENLNVEDRLESLPDEIRTAAKAHNGGFYIGENPGDPRIGDLRITFSVVNPTNVSIISEQTGATFRPYTAKSVSGSIERLEIGNHGVDEMFKHMEDENTAMTWLLRLAGLVLMAVGIGLILKPLVVLADVIPFLGGIVGAGTWFIAFLLAAFFSFATISIAWVFYRPAWGIALAIIAAIFGYLVYNRTSKATKVNMKTDDGIPVVG